MPTIEQTYLILGMAEDVWDALTNPDRIKEWSGAPAEFSAEPDAEYWLWNGDIRGRVLEVEPNQRLVQSWKPRNWDVENSVVTFTLTPGDGGVHVQLIHENVQDWDYEDTSEGWDTYYLGAIKKMIEGRSPLKHDTTKKRASAKKAAPKKNNPPAPKRTATGVKPTAKRPAGRKTGAKKTTAKKSSGKKAASKKSAKKRSR